MSFIIFKTFILKDLNNIYIKFTQFFTNLIYKTDTLIFINIFLIFITLFYFVK